MHISETDKLHTTVIREAPGKNGSLQDDKYHSNIVWSAWAIEVETHPLVWEYVTQFESGSTLWRRGDETLLVRKCPPQHYGGSPTWEVDYDRPYIPHDA